MTNLKKVLVTVLALAMILSVPVSAGVNYPDVSADASYAEATDMLNYLGIMEGDDQGNFRPDANLTRAEATAIIVRAKGLESAAEGAKGATEFADVAADHWATGYINLGQQSNIIAGYGDGNFGPEAPVLYEQAVKMVVAALGYTPMAEQNGGYPSGYLVVASQNQLTKGVSGTAQTPITRANMARLTYNALDVPTMEQISWKANEPEYGIMDGLDREKKTLLSHALEVDTYEGNIVDTYLVSGSDVEDKSITIDYTKKNGEDKKDDDTFDEAKGVDAASFFGQSVVIYVKANEETDKDEIIAIAPKATKNTSLVLDNSEIKDFDKEKKEIKYVVDGKTTTETIKLADKVTYLYNGRAEKDTEAQDFLAAPQAGFVELINNGNDKEYDFVLVTKYEKDYVVGAVEAGTKQLIDINEAAIAEIDIDNEDVITKFYTADGAVASFDDIAVDDVLTLAISADEKLVTVYISKVKVTGAVTEKRENKAGETLYTIDGNEYTADEEEVTPAVGDEGVFYINVDNTIVYKDTVSAKSDNYAYLYDAAITDGIGGTTVEVKFLTAKNEWITTKFASKVYHYENGVKKATVEFGKGQDIDGFIDIAEGKEDVTSQLFQYELNEAGLIEKVYTAGKKNEDHFSIYEDAEDAYREKYGKLGRTAIDENTVIFTVKEAKGAEIASEESIKLADAKSLFIDENDYTFVAYDAAEAAKVVVVYDVQTKILLETQILVINKVSEAADNGNKVIKIYGLQSGANVDAIVAEGCDFTDREGNALEMSAEDLATGDAVIFSLDAEGKFDKIQVLMSVDEAETLMANNAGAPVNNSYDKDEYTWDMFGFAAKRSNGKLMLTDTKENWETVANREESFLKDEDGFDFELAVAANGVNVYEVVIGDEIVKTTKASNIIVGVTKDNYDCHWAYVRMYDGEVVDVVVYRVTNQAKEA